MPVTQIPLLFRAAPLPTNFKGTPQEFADAFVARLSAESVNDISFFASGSVAPTSNVGPWLKNNVTWYVWSDSLATYVPEIIEFESLKYIASQAAPDQSKYTFWIELNGDGKAISIKYYSGGAWKDIYEDQFAAALANLTTNYSTTTQMNAAIETAVGSQDRHAFSVKKTDTQSITSGAGDVDVDFQMPLYDTGGNFADNKFTAPFNGIYSFRVFLLWSRNTGSDPATQIGVNIVVNGSVRTSVVAQATVGGFQTVPLVSDIQLNANDEVSVSASVGDAGTDIWDISPDTTSTYFQGLLIQQT